MIDLDLGAIRFARNGQPLGQAFAHIRQLEYYPAASLSYGEEIPRHGMACHHTDPEARSWRIRPSGLLSGVSNPSVAVPESRLTHAGERCEFNFGAQPFAYPVDGFRAVQQPPGDAKAAAWLLSAFQRLITSAVSCGWGLSRDTAWVCLLCLPSFRLLSVLPCLFWQGPHVLQVCLAGFRVSAATYLIQSRRQPIL